MNDMLPTGPSSPATTARLIEPRARSAFLPMLLPSLAFIVWLAVQAYQLVQERQNLEQFSAGQQAQVDGAKSLRVSLDRLAVSTQQLANAGNANARLLVDELQRRGVTINPTKAGEPPR